MGTLIGMFLGSIVAVAVAVYNFRRYTGMYFPWAGSVRSLLVTLFIGTLISVVAAVGPAYMAARKRPVEAMRVEE